MFAGGFEDDGAGKRGANQRVRELAGVSEFRRSDRGGLPFGAVGLHGTNVVRRPS